MAEVKIRKKKRTVSVNKSNGEKKPLLENTNGKTQEVSAPTSESTDQMTAYFSKLNSEVKAHARQMVDLKGKKGEEAKIAELAWSMQKKITYMRLMSVKLRKDTDKRRNVLSKKRKLLDEKDLRAKNALYENVHTQRKIDQCRNYVPHSQPIELVPEEEYFANAPSELTEAKDDPHQHHLHRLKFEHDERKSLLHARMQEKTKANKSQNELSRDRKFLDTLSTKFDSIEKSSRSLFHSFKFPSTVVRPIPEASNLPPALYYAYYSFACDLHLTPELDARIKLKVARTPAKSSEPARKRRKLGMEAEEEVTNELHPWRLEISMNLGGGVCVILEYSEKLRSVCVMVQLVREHTKTLRPDFFFDLFGDSHPLPHRPEHVFNSKDGDARCAFTWAQYLGGSAFPSPDPDVDVTKVDQVTLAKLFTRLDRRVSDQLQLGKLALELKVGRYLPVVERALPGNPKATFAEYRTSNRDTFESFAPGVFERSKPHCQYLQVEFERNNMRLIAILQVGPRYPDDVPCVRTRVQAIGTKGKKAKPEDFHHNWQTAVERIVNEDHSYLNSSNRDWTVMLLIRKIHLCFETQLVHARAGGGAGTNGIRTHTGRDRRVAS